MDVAAKLAELGLEVSAPAAPVGSYVPAVAAGGFAWTSGQLPVVDGALVYTGHVGAEVSPEQAYTAARIAAANAMMALGTVVGTRKLKRVVRLVGYVASAPGFTGQPGVINGASDLLIEAYGEAGKHARSAVGVAELPMGAPVEVELQVEFED